MSRKKWRSVMIVGILAALTAALMSSATAGAAPKAGPTVIVGSKNFTEEYILGELYSQALKAKGFSVKYKQSIDDNRIWIGAMDALIAGAGRADVSAGVMNLLSTIPAIHSARVGDTVTITNTDFPDSYQETLVVDARTGAIEKMVGGVAGQTPDVTVRYDVRRVTAADVLR